MHYLKDRWMKWVEHQMHKGFDDMVLNFEEPTTEKVFKYGNPYLDRRVEGEAILSVGKAIDFIKKGVSGIVNVMPFTCMPGTNVSAVMLKVKEKYNIPFLNMAYDGLSQATSRTRIEAFMHQARQFMLRKRRTQ